MKTQQPRKRKKPRTPVVTVSCPNCGGSVDHAELGEKTACQFCGTALHLPSMEFEEPTALEPAPPRDPVEIPRVATRMARPTRTNTPALVLACALVGIATIVFVATRRSPSAQIEDRPFPRVVERHPDTDGLVANAECTVSCTKPCLEIKDTNALIACMDKCTDKCKFVGKGTPTECRRGCDSQCAAAPDAASRNACVSGCYSSCP